MWQQNGVGGERVGKKEQIEMFELEIYNRALADLETLEEILEGQKKPQKPKKPKNHF